MFDDVRTLFASVQNPGQNEFQLHLVLLAELGLT